MSDPNRDKHRQAVKVFCNLGSKYHLNRDKYRQTVELTCVRGMKVTILFSWELSERDVVGCNEKSVTCGGRAKRGDQNRNPNTCRKRSKPQTALKSPVMRLKIDEWLSSQER